MESDLDSGEQRPGPARSPKARREVLTPLQLCSCYKASTAAKPGQIRHGRGVGKGRNIWVWKKSSQSTTSSPRVVRFFFFEVQVQEQLYTAASSKNVCNWRFSQKHTCVATVKGFQQWAFDTDEHDMDASLLNHLISQVFLHTVGPPGGSGTPSNFHSFLIGQPPHSCPARGQIAFLALAPFD